MKQFAELFSRLDGTTKTNAKVAAMVEYFRQAAARDAAWAIYFLCGRRLRAPVPNRMLREMAAAGAGIPDWLFDESYQAVGDLAETIALVVPPGPAPIDRSLAEVVEAIIEPLRNLPEQQQRERILQLWEETTGTQRLVVMKLITGSFRVGVSRGLVTRGIAEASGIPVETIAHRLMGNWQPTSEFYERMLDPDTSDTQHSQPYPFCLAHSVAQQETSVEVAATLEETLGRADQYLAEWKWDGIRGQVIRRGGEVFIWSRGGELMESRWPEIEEAAMQLPVGTVIDGEILAVAAGQVLPFTQLQRRINRKQVGKKLVAEVPVQFRAFDLLEQAGTDIRQLPLQQRRVRLVELLACCDHPALVVTDVHAGASWEMLAQVRTGSRQHQAEGLMLKHVESAYHVGRVRGGWWKWKVEPFTIDAVLIYAQGGHGRRANLFTDYTFALWQGEVLVPFAKAYSGLSDAEIRQVDRFVRQNTLERFGPVRSVRAELVMELAFEGIQPSTRHKSGVAVRFPRIARWRHDKKPQDANTLSELLDLLNEQGNEQRGSGSRTSADQTDSPANGQGR